MTIPKKVTPAKAAANKKNAKKSTGPKSIRRNKNAITHGFFAQELVLNDEERRQLETLRRGLHPQLAPKTIMQGLKFAEIMVCFGRCKVALRLEMRHVSRLLGEDSAQQAQPDQSEEPAARLEWYLSGRQGLREGIRLLEALKQEFLSLGRIDQKWNVSLDQAFGHQLRQLLVQWMPSDESAVMLAHQLTMHARTYGGSLPCLDQEQGSVADTGNKPNVILDPEQGKQMVIKLIELEESMLSDLWRSSEQRASASAKAQNDAVDYAPRYFTTACRDLDRAVDRYMFLKKNNL
jgi:hypothetical protein